MTTDPNTAAPQATHRSPWLRRLAVLVMLLIVGALIWSQLPKGSYSTDLTRVGAGKPAVVLTQDANYITGMEVMELLNQVRQQHGDRIEFLVAHMALPEAQRFAQVHGSFDGTVLLFTADGRRVAVLPDPKTTDELNQAIVKAFGR